jgi:hypothetical protein
VPSPPYKPALYSNRTRSCRYLLSHLFNPRHSRSCTFEYITSLCEAHFHLRVHISDAFAYCILVSCLIFFSRSQIQQQLWTRGNNNLFYSWINKNFSLPDDTAFATSLVTDRTIIRANASCSLTAIYLAICTRRPHNLSLKHIRIIRP